jgi:hypothetical protein
MELRCICGSGLMHLSLYLYIRMAIGWGWRCGGQEGNRSLTSCIIARTKVGFSNSGVQKLIILLQMWKVESIERPGVGIFAGRHEVQAFAVLRKSASFQDCHRHED